MKVQVTLKKVTITKSIFNQLARLNIRVADSFKVLGYVRTSKMNIGGRYILFYNEETNLLYQYPFIRSYERNGGPQESRTEVVVRRDSDGPESITDVFRFTTEKQAQEFEGTLEKIMSTVHAAGQVFI